MSSAASWCTYSFDPDVEQLGGVLISNVVVVSDTHAGCQLAICPPEVHLDEGGVYTASALQRKLFELWSHFWDVFVPEATKGEDFVVVHNGDIVDGFHHQAKTLITINLHDQAIIAEELMGPVLANPRCRGYYQVRGTEAHVGKSAENEEGIARTLGAIRNNYGKSARWDLRLTIGDNQGTKKKLHFLHHIGTTGSQAYEATAIHKELVESLIEASRWGEMAPDMIIRSHRHRYLKTEMAGTRGMISAFATPCWQGKTPFAWKIPGARLSSPQFGGVVIRVAHGELFTRTMVEVPGPSPIIDLTENEVADEALVQLGGVERSSTQYEEAGGR